MGKLTVEQKVHEYNRGKKAASEGRPRSRSEPWAYHFECDEWCTTLAVAMPDEIFWSGRSHRDHVKQVAEQAQARAKLIGKSGRYRHPTSRSRPK